MAYFVSGDKVLTDRLEVNIVNHCNLSCRSCNHLSPIASKWFERADPMEKTLTTLAASVRAKLIYLIGGEPLLHPDLLSILKAIQRSGLGERTALITNGTFLGKITDEMLDYLGRIEVSIYPKAEPDMEKLRELAERCERRGVQLLAQEISIFREAFAATPSRDESISGRIYRACNIAHMWGILFLHEDHLYKCARSHFLSKQFSSGTGARKNGLRITEGGDFFPALKNYLFDLESREPLPACANCLGTVGQPISHHQSPRAQWLAPHEKNVDDLLDKDFLLSVERDGVAKENRLYEAQTVLATNNIKPWDSFPYLERMERGGLTKNFYQRLPALAEGRVNFSDIN